MQNNKNEALDMTIQTLEQTQWIPVNERLPEPYNDVLLTICANSAYYGFNKNFMKVKCGQYQPQDDKRDWFVDGVRYYFDNVIAWMPYQLPEPYRGETNIKSISKPIEITFYDEPQKGDRAISLNAVIDVMHEMWGDSGELLDMIMQLPPVTPQPCKYAINREEVLLMIDSFKDNYGSLIDLAREVRKMPPVNPQPKTGYWIEGKCDKCGNYAPHLAIAASTYFINYTDYCPNCGARMFEPQEVRDKE